MFAKNIWLNKFQKQNTSAIFYCNVTAKMRYVLIFFLIHHNLIISSNLSKKKYIIAHRAYLDTCTEYMYARTHIF